MHKVYIFYIVIDQKEVDRFSLLCSIEACHDLNEERNKFILFEMIGICNAIVVFSCSLFCLKVSSHCCGKVCKVCGVTSESES